MTNLNSYNQLPGQNHISTWVDLIIAMFEAMAYTNSREVYVLLLKVVLD